MSQIETIEQNQPVMLAELSIDERVIFYRKTYIHLAAAILAFIAVEAVFLNIPFLVKLGLSMMEGWTWIAVLLGFMFVTSMAENWAMKATSVTGQYLAFGIYILAEAFIFIPLLYIAIYYSGDPNLLLKAGLVTLALFVGLTAVVFFTKKDFSFLRIGLMVGGFVALGLIVAGIAFGFDLGLAFSAGMVLLAAGSILYQTSNMIHKYNSSQHVIAALGLFASFMLLLWYVIRIFMSRD